MTAQSGQVAAAALGWVADGGTGPLPDELEALPAADLEAVIRAAQDVADAVTEAARRCADDRDDTDGKGEGSMSGYTDNPRVVLHDDGTATLPDRDDYAGPRAGDWLVERTGDGAGFVLRNDGDQGYVTDEGDRYNQRPKVFDSADDAIAHVIGGPADNYDDTDGV